MEISVGRGRFLGLPAGCCRSVWAWCSLGSFSPLSFWFVSALWVPFCGRPIKLQRAPTQEPVFSGVPRKVCVRLYLLRRPHCRRVHLRPKFDGDVLETVLQSYMLQYRVSICTTTSGDSSSPWFAFLDEFDMIWGRFTSSPTGLTKAKRLFFRQPSILERVKQVHQTESSELKGILSLCSFRLHDYQDVQLLLALSHMLSAVFFPITHVRVCESCHLDHEVVACKSWSGTSGRTVIWFRF